MTFDTSPAALQARINLSPFNSWLGLRIVAIQPEGVEFTVRWREEFVGTPQLLRVHGGLLAALIDAAGGYTVMARTGRSVTTIDLRADFHRAAGAGDMQIKGTVIHEGRKLACTDVRIFDASGALTASGRGTFYTPSSEPGG